MTYGRFCPEQVEAIFGGSLGVMHEAISQFMNDTVGGQPANVLVIEDSPMIRDSLVDIINAHPGRRVSATTDTEQGAIDIVRQGNVDIAIIDLQLRQGSGVGVLQRLGHETSVLKIVLTNFSSPQMRQRCLDLGANYYFDKSREFELVVQVIDAWLKDRSDTAQGGGAQMS